MKIKDDACICCGDYVPEGRYICYKCSGEIDKKNSNDEIFAPPIRVFDEVWYDNDGVTVKCDKYDLVYGKNDKEKCVEIVRMIPHTGYLLFEVSGAYAKKLTATHFFLAKSKKDAKEQYKKLYGWNATSYRIILPSDESESILTDKLRMPL